MTPLSRTAFLCTLSMGVAIVSAQGQCSSQQCPPCNTAFTPYSATHGKNNGRTIVNIYVDTSWYAGGVIDPGLESALTNAISMWNSATDPNNCWGMNTLAYWLEQTYSAAQGDIKIIKGNTNGVCGMAELPPGPMVITIETGDIATGNGQFILVHELGHEMGLREAYKTYPSPQPNCTSATSVMRGATDALTCDPIVASIQAIDVEQVNRNVSNKTSCETTATNANEGYGSEYPPCPSGPSCGVYLNPDYCTYGSTNEGSQRAHQSYRAMRVRIVAQLELQL